MTKLMLRMLFVLLPFLYSIYASAQPNNEKDCGVTCFSSEVVSVQKISEICTAYELRVSFTGDCNHALSHFTVGIPCGKVEHLSNSENWKQVIGTDPTTGLSGFKIDDIRGFGETSREDFTVKFNLCTVDAGCESELRCWQPQVAYKASTCLNYETLSFNCKQLKASLEKQDASCFAAMDGSLSVVIEDGVEPYTYLWSENTTTAALTGLGAGAYTVLIRDASGAELLLEGSVNQPEQLVVSDMITSASCNGMADGKIDLSVSGGKEGYTFTWNDGSVTEDRNGIPAGSYSVTVKDGNNCSSQRNFRVGVVSSIKISALQMKPDCNEQNGSIDISVTDGTAPYTFSWSNGTSDQDLTNIGAGFYTVTVTDNTGCSSKASYIVKENNTLNLSGVPTPTGCSGDASGSITLKVTGGMAPYTFLWSNGLTTQDIGNLESGLYSVVVADSKGCTATAGYIVSKETFQLSRALIQPSCHGEATGSITLHEPVGGTSPYTYVWSNGETGMTLTGLPAGIYSVVVTDAAGCSKTLSSVISDPTQIIVSSIVSNTQCNEAGFFNVDLNVTGGKAPYTYAWSTGASTEDIEKLNNGVYSVAVTDAGGCTANHELTVEGPALSWACIINEPNTMPVCGSTNNTLSASVLDADTYSWTVESTDSKWSVVSGNTSSVIFTTGEANSSATFTLTVEKSGCIKTCSYTMTSCSADGETDPGSENPGGEPEGPDGGNQTCEECFNSDAQVISSSGSCRTYEIAVSTNGLCRHDLSHWTLAIPCGIPTDYSNSEGWKMEFGKDPTTGLYGLKVDDIRAFGKVAGQFTVTFTLCSKSSCDLTTWDPQVAYKAGLCVSIEPLLIPKSAPISNSLSVFPNPFSEILNFEWNAIEHYESLEILDQYGNKVSDSFNVSNQQSNGSQFISVQAGKLPKGIYYYRLTLAGKRYSGKISKN